MHEVHDIAKPTPEIIQQEMDRIQRLFANRTSTDDAEDLISYAKEINALRSQLEEARMRIGELEAQLEIDHCYVLPNDGSEELIRQELPAERRKTFPDGITARDATIKLIEDSNAAKDARIASLEAALKPFAEEADRWDESFGDEEPLYDNGFEEPAPTVGDLRRARNELEGKSDE